MAAEIRIDDAVHATTRRKHPRLMFTPNEDNQLRSLVAIHGSNWSKVAAGIPGRNERKVSERWLNYLSPAVQQAPWTAAEDAQLIRLVAEQGRVWRKISNNFPGRSEIRVRSRWERLCRRAGSGEGAKLVIREHAQRQVEAELVQAQIDRIPATLPVAATELAQVSVASPSVTAKDPARSVLLGCGSGEFGPQCLGDSGAEWDTLEAEWGDSWNYWDEQWGL
jgi:hypothetical protein